jgi:SSS family solute:Na+ symporter
VGLNAACQALFAFVPPLLGLLAFAALPHLANPELALPSAMRILLPKWLGVWTLASIFSAELSATDAILFMLSTSLAVDFFKTLVRPDISQAGLLRANRVCAVLAGVAGILLAVALPSVIAAVAIFYGLLAVVLFVPVVVGLYSQRSNATTALVGILTALTVTLLVRKLTHGAGIGIFSPQLLGIASAAAVTGAAWLLPARDPDPRPAAQN